MARLTKELTGTTVDPQSLFDVDATPFQEHKRQLLTLLHVIARYWSIIEDGVQPAARRTIVFAGKAAPGAFISKLLIKAVHSVAEVVNSDARSRDWLRVVFLPDYRVTLAEQIVPVVELAEQLSSSHIDTTETGCLKAALNGALTISPRHGIALELCKVVDDLNIFLFDPPMQDDYQPDTLLAANASVRRVINSLADGHFCRGDKQLLGPLIVRLLSPNDTHRYIGHLTSYLAVQQKIDSEWKDQREWTRKALVNISRMGRFSCDRMVQEYAERVWSIRPVSLGRPLGYSKQP